MNMKKDGVMPRLLWVSAYLLDFWPQESKQTLSWSQSFCDLHPDASLLDILCHLYLHLPSVLQ